MEPWHERQPDRLLRELQAADDAGLRLRFERLSHGLIGWRGPVEVDGKSHFVQLIYPPDFPARPLWVRESEHLSDHVVDDSKTYHQMVDGSLCLFAIGRSADSWAPAMTVADTVDRYREFRRIANQRGHVDEHGLPLHRLPGQPTATIFVMTPGQRQVLRMPNARGWLYVRMAPHRRIGIVVKVETTCGLHADQDLGMWKTFGMAPPLLRIPWIPVGAGAWGDIVPDADALDRLLRDRLPANIAAGLGATPAVLCVSESEESGFDVLMVERWTARDTGDRMIVRHGVVFEELRDLLFDRVDGAMSGRAALAGWQVVCVGLGSLGSAIALHLARTGVSRFVLFDPDRLRPENVCRHVAGIHRVYDYKTIAVEGQILDRNPDAQITRFESSPLWDGLPAATAAFERLLSAPDTLFVVTTAEEYSERAINQLAFSHGRPVIFASVMGNAELGRVQRVLPGETPCYQCITLQQQRTPGRFFRAPDLATPHPPATVGYRQPGIPGVGLDVEAVAVYASRLVMQTLARLAGGALDYPDAAGHHLVVSHREAAGFDHALQVRWEPYEPDPACPICAAGSQPGGALGADGRDRLDKLERMLSAPERLTPYAVPTIGKRPEESP